jgi:putative glutamine amidotransferase
MRQRSRPVIGVLCCNEHVDRPVQVVASRFIEPLRRHSDATVLLVPALPQADAAGDLAGLLDGLLLTGSRSHVAPQRYGRIDPTQGPFDHQRDEVALALAGRMIEAGRPVFGICRGLQELNVLFGGTLTSAGDDARHHRPRDHDTTFADLFDHRHEVELTAGGKLAAVSGRRRLLVNSVHEQAVDRLGAGLNVEAISTGDGIVEAFSARPAGADVLAVQWHPEWDVARCEASRAFFRLIGAILRGEEARPGMMPQVGADAGCCTPHAAAASCP